MPGTAALSVGAGFMSWGLSGTGLIGLIFTGFVCSEMVSRLGPQRSGQKIDFVQINK